MIKTTKETCNQDITMKKNLYVEGSFQVPTFYDIYADIDGEPYSLGDYMNSLDSTYVTLATDQVITGHKYLTNLSLANADKSEIFDITTKVLDADTANVVEFAREGTKGYYNNEYVFKDSSSGNLGAFSIFVSTTYTQFRVKANNTTYKISLPLANTTLASTASINALSAVTMTNISGNRFKSKEYFQQSFDMIVINVKNSNVLYTATCMLGFQGKGAFLLNYGSTSDDIATCFAYIDNNYQLNIDLDNAQLTTGYSIEVYHSSYHKG